MRFSDYLHALPEADQHTLPVDLTLGYGRIQLAERLDRTGTAATTMLGTLAAAHANLQAALRLLAPRAAAETVRAVRAVPEDALPRSWNALLTDAGEHEAVTAFLQMALEMAHDAIRAVREDAGVSVERTLVADALDLLATVRNDALGSA